MSFGGVRGVDSAGRCAGSHGSVMNRIPRRCGGCDIDVQEAAMRRYLFWFGWIVLFLLPVIYGIQIFITQDLPPVEPWKWRFPLPRSC